MIPFLSEVDRLGDMLKDVPAGDFSRTTFQKLSQIPFHSMFSQDILPDLRTRHSDNRKYLEYDCVFSDECLVLHAHENFTIEIYHWLYSDTGIHDHNFQGAFQCLEGEDHQVIFRFENEREVFEGLEEGKLIEVSQSVIRPGDTQEIRNQDHFIHAVAHSPSTWNICVRTKGDKTQILKAYHTQGFRYALRKDREEKLLAFELGDLKINSLESTDLLHVFHMLGTKPGHQDIRIKVDRELAERHGVSYLAMSEETARYLNEMGRVAKNY